MFFPGANSGAGRVWRASSIRSHRPYRGSVAERFVPANVPRITAVVTKRNGSDGALYTATVSRLWSRLRSLLRREGALRGRARTAEAKGDLARAAALYVEAGLEQEAVRVLLTHAEQLEDPLGRLGYLARARDFSEGQERERLSRRCAEQRLELAKQRVLRLTAVELDELANELSRLNEPALAAEAHALAGNVEDQAKALVEAGAIERLEAVLDADRQRSEAALAAKERALLAHDLERSGRRREALALARAGDDATLRELARQIESRRVKGPRVVLEVDGERRQFVFGREVSLGRSGATVEIPSPAVSRSHLLLSRGEAGPNVEDVSRNGTTLNGVALDAVLTVREAITLELGGEVAVRLAPDVDFCLRVELLDEVLFAPLGAISSQVGTFDLSADGWLELIPASGEVYLGELRVVQPVQLCRGDRLSLSRQGAVVVGVES